VTPELAALGPPPLQAPVERIAFFAAPTELATDSLDRLVARYGSSSPEDADVVVALGGDGFMLETLHRSLKLNCPVYGMNCGSVGFLMNEFSEDDLTDRLLRAQTAVLPPLSRPTSSPWTGGYGCRS